MSRLEELDDAIRAVGGSATLVPLRPQGYAGHLRLAAALAERYQRLDVLVGNAGILGPLSPLDHVEPKAWDEVLAVNVTANWHLIRAMGPLLRRRERGPRGVRHLRHRGPPACLLGTLAVSKAALEALARTYAAETVSTPGAGQSVQSGSHPHPHARHPMPGEDPGELKLPEPVAEKIVELWLPQFQDTGKLYDYRAG